MQYVPFAMSERIYIWIRINLFKHLNRNDKQISVFTGFQQIVCCYYVDWKEKSYAIIY